MCCHTNRSLIEITKIWDLDQLQTIFKLTKQIALEEPIALCQNIRLSQRISSLSNQARMFRLNRWSSRWIILSSHKLFKTLGTMIIKIWITISSTTKRTLTWDPQAMETQTHKVEVLIVFLDILIWWTKAMFNIQNNKWASTKRKMPEVKTNKWWTKPQASYQVQEYTWQTIWIPAISRISSIFKIQIILLRAKLWIKIRENITNLTNLIVSFNVEISQILRLRIKPLSNLKNNRFSLDKIRIHTTIQIIGSLKLALSIVQLAIWINKLVKTSRKTMHLNSSQWLSM